MSRKECAARRRTVASLETNAEALHAALRWVIEEGIFEHLSLHGNTKWRPTQLVVLALAWTWSGKDALTDAFVDACGWSKKLLGTAAVTTYQGMAGALGTWTKRWMPLIRARMQQRMQRVGGAHWRIGKWLPLAVDGSRIGLPRTKSNEAAYGAANYGSGKTAKYRRKKTQGMRRKKNERAPAESPRPQLWTTLLWHMGLGAPWCWRQGPSDASERHHCRAMLAEETFPENTLFCGDAGFVGYDFWKSIAERGHSFLIRVGGNVRLLTKLGFVREQAGLVYCWPQQAMRDEQLPLVMRLLVLPTGRKPVYLVTNVLSERELSAALAGRLYTLRWGIEVAFRGFKQTFRRRTLRSRRADRAAVELEWSLTGLGIIQLLAIERQLAAGASPLRVSTSAAIRATRGCLESLSERPAPQDELDRRFRRATIDAYQRSRPKRARYRPKCYDKPHAGKPSLLRARSIHKQQLQDIIQRIAA